MSFTSQLRNKLLQATVLHAANCSEYYKKTIGDRAHTIKNIEDLSELPTVDKQTFATHSESFLTAKEFPERIGFSSGTTYVGEVSSLSRVYESSEEKAALQHLQDILRRRLPETQPLMLLLSNNMHGQQHGYPKGNIVTPLEKPFHAAHIADMLTKEFQFEGYTTRIRGINGSLNAIKLLTALLLRDYPEILDQCVIERVVCGNSHLSRRWRQVLSELYNDAQIYTVYGISEIPGATSFECGECGAHHMPPIVIPEVVDPFDDHRKVSEGVGELVLTGLSPFKTLQPLIRYRTGDLVSVAPTCNLVNDLAFTVKGRKQFSIITREWGVVLGATEIYEAVDALPEVDRMANTSFSRFQLSESFGLPMYSLKWNYDKESLSLVIDLEVQVNFHPNFFPNRRRLIEESLKEKIESIVCDRAPKSRFEVLVKTVPKGTLSIADASIQ